MKIHLLFSFLKLMTRSDVVTDNIGTGDMGNLFNVVCLDTGSIAESFTKSQEGLGNNPISHHPTSGLPLHGFMIPHFKKACELVLRAAQCFLPVRSIGWDVAITKDGVQLLEGNIWWDRFSYSGSYIETILDDLKETEV
jgi:hypothetical protein